MNIPSLLARGLRPALLLLLAAGSLADAQSLSLRWQGLRNTTDAGGREQDFPKVARDSSGNLFTAAASSDGRSTDWVIRKLASATGAVLWEKRLAIPNNTLNEVKALTVDPSGNPIVTGISSTPAYSDYYTAKFSGATGDVQWERRQSGAFWDVPADIATDSAGNVIVTGASGTSFFSSDYLTVKYAAANGAVLWERRHTANSSSDDRAYAVEVDAAGNVLVAGSTGGTAGVIKYAGNNGNVLWDRRHSVPSGSSSQALDLALDASGNAFITGSVGTSSGSPDLLVLRFAASNGNIDWDQRFNGASSRTDVGTNIAVDASGNVVVYGSTQLTQNSFSHVVRVAKHAGSNGALQWATVTDYSVQSFLLDTSPLALDASGNVLITGTDFDSFGRETFQTVKYSSAGALLWERNFTWVTGNLGFQSFQVGHAVTTDADANVIVTGISTSTRGDKDQLTMKYSSTGTQSWQNRYDGPLNRGETYGGVTLDSAGDVVMAGATAGSSGYGEVHVWKNDGNTGASLWDIRRPRSGAQNDDEVIAVKTDAANHVIVAGISEASSSNEMVYLAKFSATSGAVLWERRFRPSSTTFARLADMTLDSEGNLIVTGTATRSSTGGDFYTAKYSGATGAVIWERYLDGPFNQADVGWYVAVDAADNIIAAGAYDSLYNDEQLLLVKYSAAGVKAWERVTPEGLLRGLAVDPQGNAVITGLANDRLFAGKYAAATGAPLWEHVHNGANAAILGHAVATDASGHVFVTGYARSSRPARDEDFVTIKFDATTGTRLWENLFNGTGGADQGHAIAIDSAGNPHVTGYGYVSSDNYDVYTVKYAGTNGALLGSHRHSAGINAQDRLWAPGKRLIAAGPNQRVAVGNLSRPAASDYDLVSLLFEPPAPRLVVERLPGDVPVTAGGTVEAGSFGGQSSITFRIRNTGNANLTLAAPAVTPGPAGSFTVTAPGQLTVAANGSTTFSIAMAAIPGGGRGTGSVAFTHNAAGSPFSFTLAYTSLSSDASLAALASDAGGFTPAFDAGKSAYVLTVPAATTTIAFTPAAAHPAATIRVAGQAVASGSSSPALDLPTGNTVVPVVVTAEDGVTTRTYTVSVTRLPETFTLAPAGPPPLAAAGFSGAGHDLRLALAGPPVPGGTLTVLENTALSFIAAPFDNLRHGDEVVLEHEGKSYAYVVNYYGGSGNDLVLHWKSNTLAAWGDNSYGQLANGDNTNRPAPEAITRRGVLAGKTVTAVATGRLFSLALCSDGTVASWGDGFRGKLGDGRNLPSYDPVEVSRSGVLAGRTVIAIAAGWDHGLALCSDGTLAAWGSNAYGQLGDNGAAADYSTVPVAVDRSGTLAGRSVVAIASGPNHCLVLCSDGTLAAWGVNSEGQLGSTSVPNPRVPSPVLQTGVLAGRQVVAISASSHCLALCADGTIAGWGYNANGQVGDNSTTNRGVPVLVRVAGSLAGRTPVAISAGDNHSMAVCSDGTAVGWGGNGNGQLGNGATTTSPPYGTLTPVALNTGRQLGDRKIAAVSAGRNFTLVTCTDGTVGSCGANRDGELGTGTGGQETLPRPVSTAALPGGSPLLATATGPNSSHALAILPLLPPQVATLAADEVGSYTARLHARVSSPGSDAQVFFDWGTSTAYGRSIAASPASVSADAGEIEVSTVLRFLQPATTYHFRVRAENAGGITYGEDRTFTTPNDNANAASLTTAPRALVPAFSPSVADYSVTQAFDEDELVITAGTEDPNASATIGGVDAAEPVAVAVPVGTTVVEVVVTAENRTTQRSYRLHVTRLPAEFVFGSENEVPVTTPRFVAPAIPVSFALAYAPAPGTVLTVARSTGLPFISGRFSNLAQGQLITLTFGGVAYRFTANYHGGSGNDLVLQWADTTLHGWGANANGQLGAGDGTRQPWLTPAAIPATTEPRLLATAAGNLHSLALAADGTVLAWGYNAQGQLGDGTRDSRPLPAAILPGALAGKRVIALAAGAFHSLALCDDGTVAAWGYNNHGQLGNGSTTTSTTPVAVDATGVLAGKTVVSIAAGAYHSLALCADGSVAAWGFNGTGALGDNSTTRSTVPVRVLSQSPPNLPLQATAISAGQYHNLAIRTAGGIYAWGHNPHGQLGTGDTVQRHRATPVSLPAALAGKTPLALAAGGSHSLVRFDDGTLAAWGHGAAGQLGDGSTETRLSAVEVTATGALAGKTVTGVMAGDSHSLVSCADGTVVSWGGNQHGQLGTGLTAASPLPVATAGVGFMAAATGSSAFHVLAPAALPAAATPAQPLVSVVTPATLAAWRTLHFGRADSAGIAADDADPDADGVANLVEFAFGLDPRRPDATRLPAATVSGDHLVLEFTPRPDLDGLTIRASASRDLRVWSPLPDEGVPPQQRFRLPLEGAQGFLRLEVTTP
jgi:alpha-tubulin suppressor-like RCC1 family protein